MAIEDKTELTIDLDSRLAHRLEAVAAQHGVSPGDYCRQAIEDALATAAPAPLSYEEMVAALDKLEAYKAEVFGDRILPDSVPMFREMRGHDD